MQCSTCEYSNPPDARVCVNCGKMLTPRPASEQELEKGQLNQNKSRTRGDDVQFTLAILVSIAILCVIGGLVWVYSHPNRSPSAHPNFSEAGDSQAAQLQVIIDRCDERARAQLKFHASMHLIS